MRAMTASLVAAVSPALAYVVVVTTSVRVTNVADEAQLEAAVKSAVDDVLEHAIAFTPTVVTLESVRVVGNQIYLLLLIADRDGEKSIEALSALEPSQEEPADLSGGITRLLTH
jgi:Na+-translocating ferredoxin:NAD+ oxidoreductase RnfG subunit